MCKFVPEVIVYDLDDLVTCVGETSGFRDVCLFASFLAGVRRVYVIYAPAVSEAGPLGGAMR